MKKPTNDPAASMIGRFIVADQGICHGQPTFLGTRILVADVLEQVATGMAWESIVEEWRGDIGVEAIAEAIRLAVTGIAAPGLPAVAADVDGTVINTDTHAPVEDAPIAAAAKTAAEQSPRIESPARRRAPILAVTATLTVIGVCIAGYIILQPAKSRDALVAVSGAPALISPPAPTSASPVTVTLPAVEPGIMIISAVGLADPKDQKYQTDKSLLTADLRADSKSQLVEKAIALYLDRASFAKNYDVLRDRLLSI